MDLLFVNSDEIPVPIEEVHIRELNAELNPDGRRVKINLILTPFQHSPSSELWIESANGDRLSSASIIQAIDHSIEITMHMRKAPSGGVIFVHAHLYYLQDLAQDVEDQQEYEKPEVITLDRSSVRLTI